MKLGTAAQEFFFLAESHKYTQHIQDCFNHDPNFFRTVGPRGVKFRVLKDKDLKKQDVFSAERNKF